MRLPTNVIIGGRPWPIISDGSIRGGTWTSDPGEIRLGFHKSKEARMIWFLHEIFEVILAMGNHRFECYPNKDNDLFIFSHKELIKITEELYGAIRPMLSVARRK